MRLAMTIVAASLMANTAAAQDRFPEHNWMNPPSKKTNGPAPRIMYYTGNALYELCERNEAACTTYIQGVSDGISATTFGTSRDVAYCIPAGSTAKQVHDVVLQYLAAHPADRNELASALIALALSEAWPQCGQ